MTAIEQAAHQSTAESLQSTFHEQVVEHLFIAELLQEAWLRFNRVVEVMRSEVDAYGYDLVLECQGIVRHVQLKTSRQDAATSRQKVGVALCTKPSGCVVWIKRKEDKSDTKRFKLSYLFFGNSPGQPLQSLLEIEADGKPKFPEATHTKPSKDGNYNVRKAMRLVRKQHFVPKVSQGKEGMTMTDLFTYLFGPAS
ncbi:hypothetical protein [Hymenobacter psychrotolerans]|uniref:PD(D/E)XK endonuclease domain-containing protein n=1 Tax=Hymenobacter psychrotolerans DSM 18569 TaxID=1121959 RepID=A0A1M6T628_9BACT|nr:hypothetical protein [Hymenobacter psychrotolerans]SHK52435.1 hypothetical protein SAMN02746009_01091 [Hymenobacter psychrotolerans DSM 18569]